MIRRRLMLAGCAVLALHLSSAQRSVAADDPELALIPKPASLTRHAGEFSLGRGTPVVAAQAAGLASARYFAALLKQSHGLALEVRRSVALPAGVEASQTALASAAGTNTRTRRTLCHGPSPINTNRVPRARNAKGTTWV